MFNKIKDITMKEQYIKMAALCMVLGTVATSCQKEEFSSEMVVLPSQEMSQKALAHQELTLRYWIDGVEYYREFVSQEEYEAFISYLIDLAAKGYIIDIEGADNPQYAPAETQTFKTSDKAEMATWARKMKDGDYRVRITYNEATGLYTGTANKGGSRTMAANLSERE